MKLLDLLRKGIGFLLMSMGVSSPGKKPAAGRPGTKTGPLNERPGSGRSSRLGKWKQIVVKTHRDRARMNLKAAGG